MKAEPGEKALVTFRTVAFEGSIGFVNLLQATRLKRKGYDTSVLLYGPGVTLGVQRGFPTLGDETGHQNFNKQIAKFIEEGGKVYALPLRAAGAVRPRRRRADRGHQADQPAGRAGSGAAAQEGRRRDHRHLDPLIMGSRIVRAAAVQIAPDFDRPEHARARVRGHREGAASRARNSRSSRDNLRALLPVPLQLRAAAGATGRAAPEALMEQAVVVPGPVTQAVAQSARAHGVVVVLGVNRRDHGSLYNTQLVFDADGALVLKRRKITPTYHERMV